MTTTTTPRQAPPRWAKLRRRMLQGIVAAVIGAAVIAIIAILLGEFSTLLAKLLVIAVVFTLFAAFTAIDTNLAHRSERIALSGVVINIYLLLVGVIKAALAGTGNGITDNGTALFLAFAGWIWLTVIARLALLLAQGILLQRRSWRFGNINTLTGITIAFIGLLALQVSLPLIISDTDYPAIYWRATGVVAVLVGLGAALTPLIGRLFGERIPRSQVAPPAQVGNGQQGVAGAQPPRITPVAAAPSPEVSSDPTAH